MPKPDFLVIGAQKCGTTELCSSIAAHPQVSFARPKELFFFCRDDVDVLPYPFFERPSDWARFDWNRRSADLIATYEARFSVTSGQLCGEGTPLYLPSRRAAERIHQTYPGVRLIVMLRNPVERAYSAYWHHVKMRRSTQTFENHLRYENGGTLRFGLYREQLETYLGLFPREQLHVVLFEDYVRDRDRVLPGVFAFLGIPSLPVRPGARGRNAAQIPWLPKAQRTLNAIERTYRSHGETIEYDRPAARALPELAVSGVLRALGSVNLTRSRYAPMRVEARDRLNEYYQRENEGLGALIGLDAERAWNWMP